MHSRLSLSISGILGKGYRINWKSDASFFINARNKPLHLQSLLCLKIAMNVQHCSKLRIISGSDGTAEITVDTNSTHVKVRLRTQLLECSVLIRWNSLAPVLSSEKYLNNSSLRYIYFLENLKMNNLWEGYLRIRLWTEIGVPWNGCQEGNKRAEHYLDTRSLIMNAGSLDDWKDKDFHKNWKDKDFWRMYNIEYN